MKRTLALVLAAALALPLAACGGGSLTLETATGEQSATGTAPTAETKGVHDATGFSAGVGRADITPAISVPLGGYGNSLNRMSTNVRDPLYCTCLAIRDGDGNAMLVFHFDMCVIWDDFGEAIRNRLEKAVGISRDHVLLNATHTHSAPDGGTADESIVTWRGQVYRAAEQAAKDALADLDACTVSVGTTKTDRLNFVRRYFLENGFASPQGDYGTGEITGYESEADEEMRVLRFARKNQKDIIVVNWQCHFTSTGGGSKTDLSADLVGALRKHTEEELGAYFLYLQGGAGNINLSTRIEGDARFRYNETKNLGDALFAHLKDALADMKEAATGTVRCASATFIAPRNHDGEDKLEEAKEITALKNANQWDEARALCEKYGISSPYEASSIVSRVGKPAEGEIEVSCFAFGDVCLAAAPFEMFCQTYRDLRVASPFAFTLTCGYSNANQGYMPAAECFPNKGYEVAVCQYVQGTAEEITAKQLEMLNELKAK